MAALRRAGVLAHRQGDYPAARAHLEAGLALAREFGDPRSIAGMLDPLANVLKERHDYARAMDLLGEGLALRH